MNHCRPRRLKVMKPVCECKNERKIVERNEERAKWKARQRKLKTLKKQSFMHIVDISRPMVKDTTFVLSEVKKIPDEDDIKYHISEVAETVSMSSPQQVVEGLKISTPLHTPEPSKEDILQVAVHRHWSPTNIPPGPLPRQDAALKAEIDRRKKATDDAFRLIYENKSEQDAFYSMRNQEIYDEEKFKEIERNQKMKESHTSVAKEMPEAAEALHSLSKISSKIEYQKDISRKETSGEIVDKKKQYPKEAYQQDASYKQINEKAGEKIDNETIGDGDKKFKDSKFNLTAIMKVFL